jgi:hypothetical protein
VVTAPRQKPLFGAPPTQEEMIRNMQGQQFQEQMRKPTASQQLMQAQKLRSY